MSPIVRPEVIGDHSAVREVNRLAFSGESEARLVDALRDGGYARVSLVTEADGRIVGHILFSALTIAGQHGKIEALALAPMAVIPSHQQKGLGSSLLKEGLTASQKAGHRIVIVLGHPGFYPQFGFSTSMAERLKSPYSGEAFMALELVPNALDGVTGDVIYPPPFEAL